MGFPDLMLDLPITALISADPDLNTVPYQNLALVAI